MKAWDMWMVRRRKENRKPFDVFAMDEHGKAEVAESFFDLKSAQAFADAANEMLVRAVGKESSNGKRGVTA